MCDPRVIGIQKGNSDSEFGQINRLHWGHVDPYTLFRILYASAGSIAIAFTVDTASRNPRDVKDSLWSIRIFYFLNFLQF